MSSYLIRHNKEADTSRNLQSHLMNNPCKTYFLSVSVARTNNSTYYYTNILTKALVTSKIEDGNTFNDIAQNNGKDFWKVA